MATSGLLKRLATNGREDLRAGYVAAPQRPNSQGKGARIGVLWILGDVLIVLAALMIAVRGWLGEGLFGADSPYHTNIMFQNHPTILLACLGWFMLSLVLVSKRYHLYGPMQMRNALHEQRLTIQACLTAGLLLSGALYLVRGEVISRGVVIITVVATMVLLCGRRLIWRMMKYRRFESGLEVRNIIIVGTGRVGQAMRHHLDSIRHLGYSFKGYVAYREWTPTIPPWPATSSARLTKCFRWPGNTLPTRFFFPRLVTLAWSRAWWPRHAKPGWISASCLSFMTAWRGIVRSNTSVSFPRFRCTVAKPR